MVQGGEESDEDLLSRLRAGDEDSFTRLYRRRQGGIYRFALQMSGSAALAEDVVQEVFLALMRDPAGYDAARGPLAAYLYGIARKHVLRHLEREGVGVVSAAEAAAPDDPAGELARSQAVEGVRRAVLSLPPRYREVVVLCDLQEMGYAEAAAALGCAVGTVRSRLHRARALLLQKLRGGEEAAREPGGCRPARCET